MPPRPFGYVTAKAQARRQAAYVTPFAGLSDFMRAQRHRLNVKLQRSVRRVQQHHRRVVDADGSDVQFVESRKS